MTKNKDLGLALEQFRFIIFKGVKPSDLLTYTQEQYIFDYEQQMERDPSKERKLIEDYSIPILPLYRKQMEQLAKMEKLISGNLDSVYFSDDEVLDELYDEISNLETEEEWQEFKKRLLEF